MTSSRSAVAETWRERRPVPALAAHVTCVWVQEVGPESEPYRQRTVPNGSADIVSAVHAARSEDI